MLDDVVAVARAQADGRPEPDALVLPEANLVGRDGSPEELVSKVFRLHRRSVFEAFARRDDVLDRLTDLIGPGASTASCRSSSSRTRAPGASPGTRTRCYFPFEPARPIVGVWLAVTAGDPRERLPARAARLAPRAGARARARPPSRRQLRLRRDRRPRHGRRRRRADGPRRPAGVRQPPHAPLDRQRAATASGRRWCTTTAPPGRSTARRAW